jgi:hypothetical protein
MPKSKLDRLLRVRTLQLGLVQADEARARDKAHAETTLHGRIVQLSENVAPTVAPIGASALGAAAHFRERLHRSAEAAEGRLRAAQAVATRAAEATREARRDQSAIEKLIARADAEAALKELRAMEAMPPTRVIRHDPC